MTQDEGTRESLAVILGVPACHFTTQELQTLTKVVVMTEVCEPDFVNLSGFSPDGHTPHGTGELLQKYLKIRASMRDR